MNERITDHPGTGAPPAPASALVVSGAPKSQQALKAFLQEAGIHDVCVAGSAEDARQALDQLESELVIINAPLPDEFGHELALQLTAATAAGVILLVRAERADAAAAQVEGDGVLVVPKPINHALLRQAVRLSLSARKRLLGLYSENVRLLSKIDELRLIDRAKCALIQYLSMTESQAHHYIEKQAMNMRVTRREIAEGIIKAYEV